MIFLNSFKLLTERQEHDIVMTKMNVYNSLYPIGLFSKKDFIDITFDPITIFYGGNGSGKTTILNIISDTINASRRNVDKKGALFDNYVSRCDYNLIHKSDCKSIKYISSDDVFDYLLDLKAINSKVNRRKDELVDQYFDYKYNSNDFSIDQYDEIKKAHDSKTMTASKFVRTRLSKNNIIQESNGETALDFWQNEIGDNALYLIDEPENSLSAENQLKLKTFIEESTRFYGCQFIIATHSPFLLALNGAKIYDLDSTPIVTKRWTELANVKVYHDFFKDHEDEF